MIGKRAWRGLALGAATFVVVGGIATTAAKPAFAAAGSLDPAFGDRGLALSTATAGNIAALGLDAAGDIFALSNEGRTKGNLGLARFLPNGTLDSIAIPKWASLS